MPIAGIITLINGDLAQSKTKGKAFVAALNSQMSPNAITNYKPKIQGCGKKYGKK